MRTFAIALGTLAAVVAAQTSSTLSACGKTCADNMMTAEKAKELGCQKDDLKCLCANANFTYGLRDCSAAICGPEDARKVVEYGIAVCRGVGVAITTSGGGNGGSGASPSAPSPSAVPATSAAGNGNGGNSESAPVSTPMAPLTSEASAAATPLTTTIFSGSVAGGASEISSFTTVATGEDGKPTTSVGETTLAGLASASGTPSSVAGVSSETSSEALTTVTSNGFEVIKTLTTNHNTGEGSFTATSSPHTASASLFEATGTGVASSSTSIAGASIPQMTAAPVGVIVLAGLALLLL